MSTPEREGQENSGREQLEQRHKERKKERHGVYLDSGMIDQWLMCLGEVGKVLISRIQISFRGNGEPMSMSEQSIGAP